MTSTNPMIKWLTQQVSQILMISEDNISPASNLYELGFDSQDSLTLVSALSKKLDHELPPTLVEKCGSIEKISSYINKEAISSI